MSAPVPLVLAGPADLDALLPLLLGALLARPELGRAYRIVHAGETRGYAALTRKASRAATDSC